MRAGDTIPRCGCGDAIAGLIIDVTDVLGVVLEESDSNEQSGDSNDWQLPRSELSVRKAAYGKRVLLNGTPVE